MNVVSTTHVLVRRASLFLFTQLNVVNAHHTTILPSGCCIKLFTALLPNVHVNIGSKTHVVVRRTNLFLVTHLNVSKFHQTRIFPSNCIANERTLPSTDHVISTTHVYVKRTGLPVTPLNAANHHHTHILPSAWIIRVCT